MDYRKALIILPVLWLACCMPVSGAATTYLGGSPQISAVVAGTNEFMSGQDATIQVAIRNSGVASMEFVMRGTITPDDLPTTAKGVTVLLSTGDAPFIVRSDPQVVGDIRSQGIVVVPLVVRITENATEGEYQVPLTVTYTYLASSEQAGTDNIQFNYQKKTEMFPITIRVKPVLKVTVLSADAENLYSGGEGYLTLTIQNTGGEDGKKASVKVFRNGASALIPTDKTVFVGDLPRNGTVTCRFRISVSSDAGAQSYPLDVLVTYENRDGETVSSAAETIGLPVGGKVTFSAAGVRVVQGSEGVIEIPLTNRGGMTAWHAQARLSAVSPFASRDNIAYLGDLPPGGTAIARFQLGVDGSAGAGRYTLDAEVRYRDTLDNSLVSDTFAVPVEVTPRPSVDPLVLALGAAAILVLIGAGYYVVARRRKK